MIWERGLDYQKMSKISDFSKHFNQIVLVKFSAMNRQATEQPFDLSPGDGPALTSSHFPVSP